MAGSAADTCQHFSVAGPPLPRPLPTRVGEGLPPSAQRSFLAGEGASVWFFERNINEEMGSVFEEIWWITIWVFSGNDVQAIGLGDLPP